MKLGFIADLDSDLVKWCDFAKENCIDGIELMKYTPEESDFGQPEKISRIFTERGVEVAALGIWGIGLCDFRKGEHAELLKKAIQFAGKIGAANFFTGAGEFATEDMVGDLAKYYGDWRTYAEEQGTVLSVYLGHKGSFVTNERLLGEACRRVPGLGLKLDPVGIIRNLKADPYDCLFRYGDKLEHFHVKGLTQLPAGEIEPPPGLDSLDWGKFFSILYHHDYDRYIVIEPHGPFWSAPDERRMKYVKLTKKSIDRFMI